MIVLLKERLSWIPACSWCFVALYLLPIIWSCGEALLPFRTQLQKENVPVNHSDIFPDTASEMVTGFHMPCFWPGSLQTIARSVFWVESRLVWKLVVCFVLMTLVRPEEGPVLHYICRAPWKRCWHIQVHHFERRGKYLLHSYFPFREFLSYWETS